MSGESVMTIDAACLTAIRARLAATTQGEWVEHDHWIYVDGQGLMLTRIRQDAKEEAESIANRQFAAAAHQDIPELLTEVERLREAMRDLIDAKLPQVLDAQTQEWGCLYCGCYLQNAEQGHFSGCEWDVARHALEGRP